MAKILVDLHTRVIGNNHNIFVARPGEGFSLYQEFRDLKAIGPDLPGLSLRRGEKLSEQKDLPAKIRRAQKLRKWHRSGRDLSAEPERSLADYTHSGRARSMAQYLATLSGYFERAKKGDLAIISPKAWAHSALVVEFTGDPTDVVEIPVPRYGRDRISGRAFKVLAEIERRKLPGHVIDIIQKPNAFVILGKSDRQFFYNLAYTSYVLEEDVSTRFNVTTAEYKADDDLYISAFLKFAAINTIGVQKKKPTVKAIGSAVFVDMGTFSPEIRTNVNSPGFIQYRDKSIIPLVAAALFALAVSVGPAAHAAAQNDMVTIGNSKCPLNDPHTAKVHASVLTQLRLLTLDQWTEACGIATKAKDGAGLKGTATANTEKKPKKKGPK